MPRKHKEDLTTSIDVCCIMKCATASVNFSEINCSAQHRLHVIMAAADGAGGGDDVDDVTMTR